LRREETISKVLSEVLAQLMAVGLIITGALMIVLFAAGFKLISYAAGTFFGIFAAHEPSADSASLALVGVLQGLEYLFVAPLAYLLFRAFISYIASSSNADDAIRTSADHAIRIRTNADHAIRSIKIQIISLVISAVVTDLVSKILGPSSLTLAASAPGLLAIVVFSGYVVVLQRPH
jgi:hypothetical protein